MAPLLTTRQVADLLGVEPETVSRWAFQEKLAGTRTPGGHWRFRQEDVEAFLPPEPERASA